MTPEGRVKKAVTGLLKNCQAAGMPLYYEMPVPTGFGKSGLDYEITCAGYAVSVETKAPGEWLTPRQRQTAWAKMQAGAKVFCVSNDEGLAALANCLHRLEQIGTMPPLFSIDEFGKIVRI